MVKRLQTQQRIHWLSMILIFMLMASSFDGLSQTQSFPFLFKFGSSGAGAGQFGNVGHVAIDAQHRILVTDNTNKRVAVFDQNGTFLFHVGSGSFNFMGGIDVDKDDNIYVSDSYNIKVFDKDGNYLRQFSGGYAGAVAINKKRNVLYVTGNSSNVEAHNIADGALLHSFPGVYSLAIDDNDMVHVNNGTGVYQYTSSGSYRGGFSGLYDLLGLALDNAGNYYLAKNFSTNYKVDVMAASTASSGVIGGTSAGSADGQFSTPTFLAIDNTLGRIVVSDPYNSRVQVFSLPKSTISNFSDLTKNFGDAPFNLGATTNSTGSITYSELEGGTGDVSISGSSVSIVKAGTVKIRAVAGKDANFIATSKDITLTIQKANGTVTLNGFNHTYNGLAKQVTAITTPIGKTVAIEYKSGSTVVASPTDVGTYAVTATITDPNYVGSATGTLTISKGTQFITFNSLPTKTFGDSPFNLSASSSSGLTVSYTSSNPSVATISGNSIVIVGGGTSTITASQAGNSNYNAATDMQQTLTVNKADQSLSWGDGPLSSQIFGNPAFTLSASLSSALPVSYTSSNTAVATISGNTVTIVGAGTSVITASHPGNANYNPAPVPVQKTLTVSPAYQTITFNSLLAKSFGDAPFDLAATSDSGLPITYVSSNTAVATVSGSTITIIRAGTTTITASQPGNANYYNAVDAQQTLTVNKASATLTLSNLDHLYDGFTKQALVTTTPTGLSGVSITYKSGTNVISPPSSIGSYTVEATLGNVNYAAPMVIGTLIINDKPAATISNFTDLSKTYGDAVFTLNAAVNSTGALSYSEIGGTGDVTINGSNVTIIKAGTVTLRASVTSDANFAATSKDITLTIEKAVLLVTSDDKSREYGNANPALTFTLTGFKNGETSSVLTSMPTGSTVATPASNVGAYAITLANGNASNYSFNYQNGTLTIGKAALTVTAENKVRAYGDPNPAFTYTYSGFKNSETESALTTKPLATSSAVATSAVGTYDIIVDGAVSGNYNFTYQKGVLTINKANQFITWGGTLSSKTFGDAAFALSASSSSTLAVSYTSSNTAVATISGSTVTIVGAGTSIITANQSGNANYNSAAPLQKTLTVGQANQTITFSSLSAKSYGDAAFDLAATSDSGLPVTYVSGNTAVATVSGNTVTIVGAGTSTITASQSGNTNYYSATNAQQTLTINKASATMVLSNLNHFFDGSVKTATVTTTPNGLSGVTITYKLSGIPISAATQVAGYSVEATLTNPNYSAPMVTAAFTISNKPEATISNFSNLTKTYGDPAFTLNATSNSTGAISYSMIAGGTGDVTINGSTVTIVKAGSVTLSASVAGDANFAAATEYLTLSIFKASATLALTNLNHIFDGSVKTATVTTTPNGLSGVTITYKQGAATISAPSAIGNYSVEATLTNPNYSASMVTAAFTISNLPSATINNFAGLSKTYGDPAFTLNATTNSTGAISYNAIAGGTGDVTLTGSTVTIVKAGTVTLRASVAGDANFAPTNKDITLDIAKADLTATADNKARIYGDINPSFTISFVGFKYADTASDLVTPTASTSAALASDAGEYDIVLSGGSSDNYNIVNQNGKLTVEKASLTVKVNNAVRIYGDENPAATLTYSGLKNGESDSDLGTKPLVSTSAIVTSVVGTYDLVPSGAASSNYDFVYQNGTLTIEKAPLISKADNVTRVYKENNPTFTITYTGFKNGEDKGVINSEPIAATVANADSDAGDYAITLSGGDDDNYRFDVLGDGVLSVAKASQSITVQPINDKGITDPEFMIEGVASSGLGVVYTINGPATLQNGNEIKLDGTVGTVTVRATQSGNGNYEAAQEVVITFDVTTKQSQVITFGTLSTRRFHEGNFNLGAQASSSLGITYTSSDNSIVEINGSQAVIRTVGTVTITATQPGNDQYNSALPVSRQLVIDKGLQVITFEALENRILGDEPFTLEATSSANLTVNFASSNTTVATISGTTVTINGNGETIIKASNDGNAEYDATSITQILTINLITGDSEYDLEKETTVYPNPAIDHIAVDGRYLEANTLLVVTDAKGLAVDNQVRIDKPLLGQSFKIDISQLKPGVYLLQIKSGKDKIMKRIIKQ